MCRMSTSFRQSTAIGVLVARRLDVGQQPLFDPIEDGVEDFVLVLEVAVDARGHQAHAPGDGRHAQPP